MSVHNGRQHRRYENGLTLVELVIVITVTSILALASPPLVLQGVQSFVYLPRAEATHRVATEILQTITEGSYSTLASIAGQPVRGLRLAARQVNTSAAQAAIWLAEDNRIGYLLPHDPSITSDDQYVMIRLTGNQLRRAVLSSASCAVPATEEVIPYDAAGSVSVVNAGATPMFRYFTQNGVLISAPGGCTPDPTIRRVDITFTVQTGNGQFDQADAQVRVASSVAIRFP